MKEIGRFGDELKETEIWHFTGFAGQGLLRQ